MIRSSSSFGMMRTQHSRSDRIGHRWRYGTSMAGWPSSGRSIHASPHTCADHATGDDHRSMQNSCEPDDMRLVGGTPRGRWRHASIRGTQPLRHRLFRRDATPGPSICHECHQAGKRRGAGQCATRSVGVARACFVHGCTLCSASFRSRVSRADVLSERLRCRFHCKPPPRKSVRYDASAACQHRVGVALRQP